MIWILNSSCSSPKSSNKLAQLNDSIESFIFKFDSLQLPFAISNPQSFSYFNDTIVVEDGNSNKYIPNPVFKVPFAHELNSYIRSKYILDDSKYLCLYRYKKSEFWLLMFKKTTRDNLESWFFLNTINQYGEIIDTLRVAGFKVYDNFKYCEIDTGLNILLRTLKELPEDDNNTYDASPAIEIKEEYNITDDGFFKRISFMKENGYFIYKGDKIIRVDKQK